MFKHIVKLSIVIYVFTAAFSANALVVQKEDPLRPPEYKVKKTTVVKGKDSKAVRGWYVNEIIFSGNRRIAIVNNVAVTKGDRVNGARVIDIKPEHVVLNYKDKTVTARLRVVPVKKIAKRK